MPDAESPLHADADAQSRSQTTSPPGEPSPAPSRAERLLAQLLRPFGKVEPREALSTILLTLNVFLLLTAYYFLKTAREPLILLHGGAEVKSYAAAGQAILLVGVVKAYAAIARRVGRLKLMTIVYLFFAANLIVFAALTRAGAAIAIPFYLWVGVFNNTAIAQFWAFSTDIFTAEQGKRLFAILGIGSSAGAVAGAAIARAVVPWGPAFMMLGAGVILVVCVGLFACVDRGFRGESGGATARREEQAVCGASIVQLLLQDRYLVLLSVLTLVLNCANSNGEYIIDRTLLAAASEGHTQGMSAARFVAAFKADTFAWVNVGGVLLQMFAVSRVLSRFGMKTALLILPIVTFVGYGIILVSPVLALIRIARIAEKSIDYSLENTARQGLFLVATRSEKYLGKTLVDTFMVRMGDVLSALIVWFGTRAGLRTSEFAFLTLILVGAWIAVVAAVGNEYGRRLGQVPRPAPRPALQATG